MRNRRGSQPPPSSCRGSRGHGHGAAQSCGRSQAGRVVPDNARAPQGHGALRQVIELAEPASESAMETRLRMLLVLAGLPRPEAQVPLHDERGRFVGRPDLYYPEHRLGLEYDGATHRTSLAQDNRRQNRLQDAGYRLLRFTAADINRTPDGVVALVTRQLR